MSIANHFTPFLPFLIFFLISTFFSRFCLSAFLSFFSLFSCFSLSLCYSFFPSTSISMQLMLSSPHKVLSLSSLAKMPFMSPSSTSLPKG